MRARGRRIPEDVQERITRQWISEAVLLDWEGVTDAKGKAITFSAENAAEVFKAFPDFLDEVVFFANQAETFRAESLEAAKGN